MDCRTLKQALDAQAPASQGAALFSSAAWLVPWLEYYSRPGDRYLPADHGIPLPMMIRRQWHRGLPIRELRFLGTGDDESDEVATEYPDLPGELAERGATGSLLPETGWDLLCADNVLPESRIARLLRDKGAWCAIAGQRFRVPLPPTPERWIEGLGRSTRAKVRRTRREIGARGLTLEILSGSHAVNGLSALQRLHQKRWQGEGTFNSERFMAFHRALLSRQDSPGKIALLSGDAGPVAAWYGFDDHDTRYFYQGGFVAESDGHFSPGMAMHILMIEDAITRNLAWYDFMKGQAGSYKSRLAAESSPVLHLRLPGTSMRGRLLDWYLQRNSHWQRAEACF